MYVIRRARNEKGGLCMRDKAGGQFLGLKVSTGGFEFEESRDFTCGYLGLRKTSGLARHSSGRRCQSKEYRDHPLLVVGE